jgi:hypothetical protein
MVVTPKGVARLAMSNTRASSITGKMLASGQETVVAGSRQNTFLWIHKGAESRMGRRHHSPPYPLYEVTTH